MSGIQFVVDERGEQTAVQIDLRKHRRLWEDFYDNAIAESRQSEKRDSWTRVKARLTRAGKLDG
jgi:hypothetical protein